MSLNIMIRCEGKQPATTTTTLIDALPLMSSPLQQPQNDTLPHGTGRENQPPVDAFKSSKPRMTEHRSNLGECIFYGSCMSISVREATNMLLSCIRRSVKQVSARLADLISRLLLPYDGNARSLTRAATAAPTVYTHEETLEPAQKLPKYTHKPLDIKRRQIRLFQMSREKSNDGYLQGHLQMFDLANAPRYTALSYTWRKPKHIMRPGHTKVYLGDCSQDEERHLAIDGQRLLVNENLHDFLVIFHKITQNIHTRWLWIDQICIDQSRVAERNHQVGVMSHIYTKCDATIAWLGIDDRGLPFIEHPYFRRQWIVQELILPRNVPSFLAGRNWLDAKEMMKGPKCQRPILQYAFSPEKDKTMSLEICLSKFSTECSQPRDYVYGFLGLIEPQQRPLVDYSKSLKEVFLDAVLSILNTENPQTRTERWDDKVENGVRILFKKMVDNRVSASRLATTNSFTAAWWKFRASLIHSGVSRYACSRGQKIKKLTAVGFEDHVWWHEYRGGMLKYVSRGERVYSSRISAVGTAGSAQVYNYDGEIYQSWPLPERRSNGQPLRISDKEVSGQRWAWFDATGERDSDLELTSTESTGGKKFVRRRKESTRLRERPLVGTVRTPRRYMHLNANGARMDSHSKRQLDVFF